MEVLLQTKILSNWNDLQNEDENKIMNERKRLGIRLGKGGNWQASSGKDRNKPYTKLKKQNKKFKRRIQALQSNVTEEACTVKVILDAGDAFGGCQTEEKKLTTKTFH